MGSQLVEGAAPATSPSPGAAPRGTAMGCQPSAPVFETGTTKVAPLDFTMSLRMGLGDTDCDGWHLATEGRFLLAFGPISWEGQVAPEEITRPQERRAAWRLTQVYGSVVPPCVS